MSKSATTSDRALTSAATSQVLTADQAGHVERIKEYHKKSIDAFGDQMGYAFLIGIELSALKEATPHGQFEALKQAHFQNIPHRSLARYHQFAESLRSKYATVADLKSPKLLGNGGLDEESRDTLLKAVHEAADGKTLTEFYRDLGLIRQPQKPKYTPPKPMSPQERAEAEENQAAELVNQLINLMRFVREKNPLARVSEAVAAELAGETIDFGHFMRDVRRKTAGGKVGKGAKGKTDY